MKIILIRAVVWSFPLRLKNIIPSLKVFLSAKWKPTLFVIVVLPIPGTPSTVVNLFCNTQAMISYISCCLPTNSLILDTTYG